MNRRHIQFSVIAALGLALLPGSALAQPTSLKDQLIGTWTLVSNDGVARDGTKRQIFGPNPKGILIFSPNGQFAQIILRPDVPKFAVNNRLQGTAEENKAVVHGTTAQFGTWSVDEVSKTLIVHMQGSLLPNQMGTDSKRSVALVGDELKVSNLATGADGSNENVWKRAK
jgi:hypothetical protein